MSSLRKIEWNGTLTAHENNVTVAEVATYFGAELGAFVKRFGFKPDEKVNILRSASELKKAINNFNGKPLLSRHNLADAKNIKNDLIIGSTGQDARFKDPYVEVTLYIWDQTYIDRIKSGDQSELSAGYIFDLEPEQGVYKGKKYDYKMVDIQVDHIALVDAGRAGPMVRVSDRSPLASELENLSEKFSNILSIYANNLSNLEIASIIEESKLKEKMNVFSKGIALDKTPNLRKESNKMTEAEEKKEKEERERKERDEREERERKEKKEKEEREKKDKDEREERERKEREEKKPKKERRVEDKGKERAHDENQEEDYDDDDEMWDEENYKETKKKLIARLEKMDEKQLRNFMRKGNKEPTKDKARAHDALPSIQELTRKIEEQMQQTIDARGIVKPLVGDGWNLQVNDASEIIRSALEKHTGEQISPETPLSTLKMMAAMARTSSRPSQMAFDAKPKLEKDFERLGIYTGESWIVREGEQ